jgi:thiol-disulfide isomerase/thioredoxin
MATWYCSESKMVPRVQPRRSLSAQLMRQAVSACFGMGLLVFITSCGGAETAAGSGVANGVSQAPGMSTFPVNRRTAAPALSGPILGGGHIALTQLRGRVVVLNAWGSWCAPCRAEAPTLESVYRQTNAKGVSFLGINVRDNDAAARAFQRTFGITYPSIPDTDGQVIASFRQLPPNAIPTTLVLDRHGRVAARFIGGVTQAELLPTLLSLVSESK